MLLIILTSSNGDAGIKTIADKISEIENGSFFMFFGFMFIINN
jgi:hypothetical protein